MEVVALLTSLNAMGMPVGYMALGAILYVVLKRDMSKAIRKQIPEIVKEAIRPLVSAIESHEKTTDARFERIETHIKIKKGS